ncbi:hypothetical protein ASE00_12885 [Sphingomonas sp. Root710]|uniref:lasso peptide biosynthesis B2 protein n=1 Tax=Sphingomonas sp. Root710 TaxID=1736594 RepID=UPI0006FE774C|nr:lasso peptide biosynthesis B2 protein [Sphingomonas sp. Root710]KRB82892.1 hypothetical protein ASE00_12885 [Sphingomonas sp. Root710]
MRAVSLAPDVHLAVVDGDLVFLDAASDQYLCVARRHGAAVLAALAMDASCTDSHEILDALIAERLLVEQANPAPWAGRVAETAQADLGRDPPSRLGAADLARLIVAAGRVASALRAGSPARWFAERQARRARRPRRSSAGREMLCECARRVDRLRPLVPRSGRCLVRSFLLLEYLRLCGADAQWVFGVRTHPFEAHCWVEYDGIVLTDTLEHVRWFTPILVT